MASAFEVFSKGVHSSPWYWIAWIYLLLLINGILPLAFLPRYTALMVLVSSLTGFAIGLTLTQALGYGKHLGLMHFPWIPMVCFQIYVLSNQHFRIETLHDTWLFASLCVSLASLALDVRDVVMFLRA